LELLTWYIIEYPTRFEVREEATRRYARVEGKSVLFKRAWSVSWRKMRPLSMFNKAMGVYASMNSSVLGEGRWAGKEGEYWYLNSHLKYSDLYLSEKK
jgi:hypothetical protein